MRKKIVLFTITASLMASLVSCGPKKQTKESATPTEDTTENTTRETTTKDLSTERVNEQTTEEPINKSSNIQTNFLNYLNNENYGGLLKTTASKEVLKIINSIKKEENLVNRYPINEYNKTKQRTPSLEINGLNETIRYYGDNEWAFISDKEASIYKVKGGKEASLPCAFLSAQLCIPYAFAKSAPEVKTNNTFMQLNGLDLQDIADHMIIDYTNLTEKSNVIYPDSKVVNEYMYLYKDDSTYINYSSTKINGGDNGKAYYLQKDEYNHETGFSNEDNYYNYLRYKNEKYYRPDTHDVYYKAKNFQDDFFIKNENLFFEQVAKTYKFEYSFPVKIYDNTYNIVLFSQGGTYLAILFDDTNHPGKAWSVNKDGVSIATDIIYVEENNASKAEEWFKGEIEYAKSRLKKEGEK